MKFVKNTFIQFNYFTSALKVTCFLKNLSLCSVVFL